MTNRSFILLAMLSVLLCGWNNGLCDRTLMTRVGASLSCASKLQSGVIQWNNIGPVAFAIFVDALASQTALRRGSQNSTLSYGERLALLELPIFELHRLHLDLICCYNVIDFEIVWRETWWLFDFRTSLMTRGQLHKIYKPSIYSNVLPQHVSLPIALLSSGTYYIPL